MDGIVASFRAADYICDRSLATAVFLALELGRPLLLEGEAGVGKTELAKTLATTLGTRLIRLQCYEGLDVNSAVYEWNYPRQMLEIRLLEAAGRVDRANAHDIFGPEFLIKRPLLQALESPDGRAPVLLIDEIDRADEEFEAYLLEILSDFQVTVPEIGTVRAERTPRVVLTSNRTREVHDALKRRCLYHWIDYPSFQRELEIVLTRVPDAPDRLAGQIVGFVHRLREADLTKVPGVAETIDWASALLALGATELRPELVDETLGVVLKYEEDVRARPRRSRPADPRRGRRRRLSRDASSRKRARSTLDPRHVLPPLPGGRTALLVDGEKFSGSAVRFARSLRVAGLTTDLGAAIDFARALGLVEIGDREQVRAGRGGRLRPPARRPRDLRRGLRPVLAESRAAPGHRGSGA